MAGRVFPLLALDGGGTKCHAVVADAKGAWLGEGRAGSGNYQSAGKEAAAREITRAVRAAVAAAVGSAAADSAYEAADGETGTAIRFRCAVFALAGLDTEQDRAVLTELVAKIVQDLQLQADLLVVENDGFAALLGATGGEPGVLVISGTGSIVFGMNRHGASCRAGGWGHRIGDEGSGYWIGKQAIMAVMRAWDGRGQPTMLTERLLAQFGFSGVEQLYNWTYSPDYSIERVAQLSHIVHEAGEEGDTASRLLMEQAADELHRAAAAVIHRLGLENERFYAIFQGGVLQHSSYLRRLLDERIRTGFLKAQWDPAAKEPIHGVISMGKAHLQQAGLQ